MSSTGMYKPINDLVEDFPRLLLPSSPQLVVTRSGVPANTLCRAHHMAQDAQELCRNRRVGKRFSHRALLLQNITGAHLTMVAVSRRGPALQDLVAGRSI